MKYVKSKQPNIVAIHKGYPSYEIEFGSEPKLLKDEIADHLALNGNFEIIETKKAIIDVDLDADYKKELEKIKGIGKKTAKDIITIFKSKEALIDAIKRGDRLSFDDNICRLLKEKYGG